MAAKKRIQKRTKRAHKVLKKDTPVLANPQASVLLDNLKTKYDEVTAKRGYLKYAAILVVLVLLYFFKGVFVAAVVNNQPIARLSVVKALEKQQGQSALDNLITETLVSQEAKKAGIVISQEEVAAQITQLEGNFAQQGQTLDSLLSLQGMTRAELAKQVRLQKTVEKLLSDRVTVTDDDITSYIEQNKDFLGNETDPEKLKEDVRKQLQNDKLGQEFQAWIEEVKNSAKINYFVNY